LAQVPVEPHVIDKGIPTPGLLAQVLINKFADHLPLYRQEAIFGRAGVALPRSTLAQWVGSSGVELQPLVDALKRDIMSRSVLHADETPVQMLKPGKGKTHRAYLGAYAAGAHEDIKAVVYDFCESRAGANAKAFLDEWRGALVVDDFSGYKQLMGDAQEQITEVVCWAHARRRFHDLQLANQSQIAEQAVRQIAQIYAVEREVKDLNAEDRLRIWQDKSLPLVQTLHDWLMLNRQKVPEGSATAKAIDYSLRRWKALTRFLQDGQVPEDNNWIENQIRPIALSRNNWLFAGSLRAGQRAAAVMSLIQSAKLNGHDPHAYLKDVLTRLPTHTNSRLDELLPHRWTPV
jgi:transposase